MKPWMKDSEICLFRKYLSKAINYYEKAIRIHQKIGFKYGLTYWLEGKSDILFEKGEFSAAKKHVDEWVKLSIELSKPDMIFLSKVLAAKIDFQLMTSDELRMTSGVKPWRRC